MISLPNFITFFLVIVFSVIKILFIRRKNKLIFRASTRTSRKKMQIKCVKRGTKKKNKHESTQSLDLAFEKFQFINLNNK